MSWYQHFRGRRPPVVAVSAVWEAPHCVETELVVRARWNSAYCREVEETRAYDPGTGFVCVAAGPVITFAYSHDAAYVCAQP